MTVLLSDPHRGRPARSDWFATISVRLSEREYLYLQALATFQ